MGLALTQIWVLAREITVAHNTGVVLYLQTTLSACMHQQDAVYAMM